MFPFVLLQSAFLLFLTATTTLLLWPRARVDRIFLLAVLTWLFGVSTVLLAFHMRGPQWAAAPLRHYDFTLENGARAPRAGMGEHHRLIFPAPVRRFPARMDALTQPLIMTARMRLEPDGRVTDPRIRQSSGDGQLDQALLACFQSWRFGPAPPERAGPAPEYVDVTVRNNYYVTRPGGSFWLFVLGVPLLWAAAVFLAPAAEAGVRARVQRVHLAAGLLACVGWLLIYRLAPDKQQFQLAQKQQTFLLLGLLLLAAYPHLVLRFRRLLAADDALRRRFSMVTLGGWTWALLGTVLLALTLWTPLGTDLGTEAKLWMRLPFVGEFQTIEVVKLFFVGFVACRACLLASRFRTRTEGGAVVVTPADLVTRLGAFGLGFLLLFLVLTAMKDFGPVLLLFFFLVATLFVIRETRLAGLLLGTLAVLMVLMYAAGVPTRWKARVDIWRDPWTLTQADACPRVMDGKERPSQTPGGKEQVAQALWAVSSGGPFGLGWGQGKPQRIEAVESDFAFDALAEEIGGVGASCVLVLLGYVALSFTTLARYGDLTRPVEREDAYEKTLLLGGGVLLGAQALLILAGDLRLFPLTGVTFPFISYGGASLLMSFLLVGLLTGTASGTTERPDPFPAYARADRQVPRLRAVLLAGLVVALGALARLQLAPGVARDRIVASQIPGQVALKNPRLSNSGRVLAGWLLPGRIVDRTGRVPLLYPTPRGWERNDAVLTPSLAVIGGANPDAPTLAQTLGSALRGERQGTVDLGDSWSFLPGPRQGYDVALTIDTRLQRLAEEELRGRHYTGAIVGIVPQTGEVLFAAGRTRAGSGGNWYQTGYAPGSTFKTLTLAAGLESSALTMRTTFPCTGQYLGIRDSKRGAHGEIDAGRALQVSCNSFYGQAAVHIGWVPLTDLAENAGFGKSFSLVPSVLAEQNAAPVAAAPSSLHNMRSGTEDRILARTGIGQWDVRMTPLHLAVWTATLANRGQMVPPTLVRAITAHDGRSLWTYQPPAPSRVFSEENGEKIVAAMEDVVSDGTGRSARMAGLRVAGKTGTAQKEPSGQDALFIAFAPADRPRIAIAALIEDGASGGGTAAPVVRRMLEATLRPQEGR